MNLFYCGLNSNRTFSQILISILTSAGAIKPSLKIQTPDIKVGIPSMLLCIEMAIFSVFHLWAFPWRVYDIRRSQIVAAESAPGFLPDPNTAYKGGPFGVKALMDAFNPWDLVKAIGRGFKWGLIGRKNRTDDISYKNGQIHGTGLEPTRNQITAFKNSGNASFDGPDSHPYVAGGGKPSRYHPVSEEDDSDHLLAHAQSNPVDANVYPRPMERLPNRNGGKSGDIGTVGIYDPPPGAPQTLPYPDPRSHPNQGQEYGVSQHRNLEGQDTSYHGTRGGNLTPMPPPDPHPLGPAGRRSHEEWDMWDGADPRESERDLGGGHGVGDNRF